MYTVKQAAQRLGMSEYTIRFYTDKGLIPSLKRDGNNRRLFDEESLHYLATVKCLRECGMPVDSVKAYCDLCSQGDSTIQARYDILLKQTEAARRQLEEAQARLKHLNHKVENLRRILDGRG